MLPVAVFLLCVCVCVRVCVFSLTHLLRACCLSSNNVMVQAIMSDQLPADPVVQILVKALS